MLMRVVGLRGVGDVDGGSCRSVVAEVLTLMYVWVVFKDDDEQASRW